jgi:hypothetical protein
VFEVAKYFWSQYRAVLRPYIRADEFIPDLGPQETRNFLSFSILSYFMFFFVQRIPRALLSQLSRLPRFGMTGNVPQLFFVLPKPTAANIKTKDTVSGPHMDKSWFSLLKFMFCVTARAVTAVSFFVTLVLYTTRIDTIQAWITPLSFSHILVGVVQLFAVD